jgi:hypothetical protein
MADFLFGGVWFFVGPLLLFIVIAVLVKVLARKYLTKDRVEEIERRFLPDSDEGLPPPTSKE